MTTPLYAFPTRSPERLNKGVADIDTHSAQTVLMSVVVPSFLMLKPSPLASETSLAGSKVARVP